MGYSRRARSASGGEANARKAVLEQHDLIFAAPHVSRFHSRTSRRRSHGKDP